LPEAAAGESHLATDRAEGKLTQAQAGALLAQAGSLLA